ncbi:MAG: ribonuclease HII [Patescibacteria group bacterium]
MYTIGIDEAGRGALAGPVVVGAVAVPYGFNLRIKHLPKLKDSKALSSRQREVWYQYIQENPLIFSTSARIYQKKIDKINITQSANIAASYAFEGLLNKLKFSKLPKILLDGSLYLGSKDHKVIPSKTIVRGDEKINSIKLASIVAKVTRDRYLEKLDRRYPEYRFGSHKGYGTKAHFLAIKKYGVLDVHRLTYLKPRTKIKHKIRAISTKMQ